MLETERGATGKVWEEEDGGEARRDEARRGGARERKRWMPPSGRQTSSPSTDAIPSYLLRRMNHCNGIKQNKLARYYVCTEK